MYAKLTNAVDLYRGNPIYINPDHVSAVYEVAKTPGGSLVTIIYGGFQGLAWEVEESLSDAVKTLKVAKDKTSADVPVVTAVASESVVITDAVVSSVETTVPKKTAVSKKKVTKTVDSTDK